MSHQFAIEHLLEDPEIMEIMINGYHNILVEKQGKLLEVASPYQDETHLRQDIEAILTPLGRVANESHPIIDARLGDGSRVNIVVPPIALNGATVTIRKYLRKPLTAEDLLRFGAWTEDILTYLRACVDAHLNIAVSGGTGSGKTTLLNNICDMISPEERIISIEEATSIQWKLPRVVQLEARPANIEGRGEISMQDLVINAMRMRPDRIVVGDVNRGEAFYILQAMATGYDGSLFTIHANSARDVLGRLEMMMSQGSPTTPLLALREAIAVGLDVIVHIERLPSGVRRVMSVTEIVGVAGDVVSLQDIFVYSTEGYHTATGTVSKFLRHFKERGIEVPMNIFAPR